MRDNAVSAFLTGIVVGIILAGLATVIIVSNFGVSKCDAIKHGAAYYHPETGKFTWKKSAAAVQRETNDAE